MATSTSTATKPSISPDEQPTIQDIPRVRYLWLCQVYHAGRMIALGQCPIICIASTKPEHQVQRALQVLFSIIHSQIEEDVDCSNVRLGTYMNWFQQRFCPAELSSAFVDHLENDEDDPVDPVDEAFPERASPGPRPQVTDHLCVSRFEFLTDLRNFLYCLQDRGTSMETTWQELWTHFISRMGENEYLLQYQGGYAAATEWFRLDYFEQARFLHKAFRLDRGALTWWLQAHPDSVRVIETPIPNSYTAMENKATLREIHIFTSYARDLPEYLMDYVVDRGYQDTCARFEDWYKEIRDRSQLPDSDCQVCFRNYELQTEVTAESELPICEPVKLSCGHYVCLPCLKNWAQSDAENHNKCPFCRAQTSPLNPSEKLQDLYNEGMTAFYASSSAIEGAANLLQVFDSFFLGLPVSIPNLNIALTEEVDVLGHWVSNITRPLSGNTVAFEFATDLVDSPMMHDEMRSWAALKSLYWSCQRLRSYRICDADGFRLACQAQFRARVLFETLSYANKLFDALLDFDDDEDDNDNVLLLQHQDEEQGRENEEDDDDVDEGEQDDEEEEAVEVEDLRNRPVRW